MPSVSFVNIFAIFVSKKKSMIQINQVDMLYVHFDHIKLENWYKNSVNVFDHFCESILFWVFWRMFPAFEIAVGS